MPGSTPDWGALAGVRVLEAASMLAAPLAGMMLADHGAEVVKIEMPGGGDQMRHWGYQKGEGGLFWKMIGRNKRLVTLDLRTDEAREAFLELLADADVLIENFRPGTFDRWGLGPDVLRSVRRDLIVLRVSGFGQTGPGSTRPGFGTLAEGMSGFAYITGWPDRPPTLPPFGLADSIAGLTGAFGVLAALHHRDRTGEGQEVDVSLYEPLLTVLGSQVLDYDQLGVVQERVANASPFSAPRNAYPTADGKWFALSGSSQNTAVRTFTGIGRPELAQDPRFLTNELRVANRGAPDALITAWSSQRTLAEALEVFGELGVPAGPINTVADLLADPHVIGSGSVVTVEDEELGAIRMQAPIPRLTRTPGRIMFPGGRQGADHDAFLPRRERVADGAAE